jgi:hypothetical protein
MMFVVLVGRRSRVLVLLLFLCPGLAPRHRYRLVLLLYAILVLYSIDEVIVIY